MPILHFSNKVLFAVLAASCLVSASSQPINAAIIIESQYTMNNTDSVFDGTIYDDGNVMTLTLIINDTVADATVINGVDIDPNLGLYANSVYGTATIGGEIITLSSSGTSILNGFSFDEAGFTLNGSRIVGGDKPALDLTNLSVQWNTSPTTFDNDSIINVDGIPNSGLLELALVFNNQSINPSAPEKIIDTSANYVAIIPEPTSWLLILAGAPLLLNCRIRRIA